MRTAALVCLILSLAAAPAAAQAPKLAPVDPVAQCGVEDLDLETARWIENLLKSRPRPEMRTAGSVQIPVAFHVIHAGKSGRVSDAQIEAVIDNLNIAFRDTPFSFHLMQVDRTNNKSWYNSCLFLTKNERNMKRRLAVDPKHVFNIYTCKMSNFPQTSGVIGYAYFPFMFPENSYMHGAVLHPATMPGSGDPRVGVYGLTAVHEVGHYLGLYHTFQGGCGADGDFVADTPAQFGPTGRCATGIDSCLAPGLDDVPNFMNYTDDLCMEHFSPQQVQRMVEQVSTFRPGIYN